MLSQREIFWGVIGCWTALGVGVLVIHHLEHLQCLR